MDTIPSLPHGEPLEEGGRGGEEESPFLPSFIIWRPSFQRSPALYLGVNKVTPSSRRVWTHWPYWGWHLSLYIIMTSGPFVQTHSSSSLSIKAAPLGHWSSICEGSSSTYNCKLYFIFLLFTRVLRVILRVGRGRSHIFLSLHHQKSWLLSSAFPCAQLTTDAAVTQRLAPAFIPSPDHFLYAEMMPFCTMLLRRKYMLALPLSLLPPIHFEPGGSYASIIFGFSIL